MIRPWLILAIAVMGGVIVHIGTILLWPGFAGEETAQLMEELQPTAAFAILADDPDLPDADPSMVYGVCRFTLRGGPVRVTADPAADFWSASVFDVQGRNVFSLNDRSTGLATLDLFLARPPDIESLRTDPPALLDEVVVVEMQGEEGFVLLRAFAGEPFSRPRVSQSLETGNCDAPFSLAPPVPEPEAEVAVPEPEAPAE